MAQDKEISCRDCARPFLFGVTEQDFFKQNQFEDPIRCPSCRAEQKKLREKNEKEALDRIAKNRKSQRSRSNVSKESNSSGPIVQYRSRLIANSSTRNYGPSAHQSASTTPPRSHQDNTRRSHQTYGTDRGRGSYED
jgi:hypothetical protein